MKSLAVRNFEANSSNACYIVLGHNPLAEKIFGELCKGEWSNLRIVRRLCKGTQQLVYEQLTELHIDTYLAAAYPRLFAKCLGCYRNLQVLELSRGNALDSNIIAECLPACADALSTVKVLKCFVDWTPQLALAVGSCFPNLVGLAVWFYESDTSELDPCLILPLTALWKLSCLDFFFSEDKHRHYNVAWGFSYSGTSSERGDETSGLQDPGYVDPFGITLLNLSSLEELRLGSPSAHNSCCTSQFVETVRLHGNSTIVKLVLYTALGESEFEALQNLHTLKVLEAHALQSDWDDNCTYCELPLLEHLLLDESSAAAFDALLPQPSLQKVTLGSLLVGSHFVRPSTVDGLLKLLDLDIDCPVVEFAGGGDVLNVIDEPLPWVKSAAFFFWPSPAVMEKLPNCTRISATEYLHTFHSHGGWSDSFSEEMSSSDVD